MFEVQLQVVLFLNVPLPHPQTVTEQHHFLNPAKQVEVGLVDASKLEFVLDQIAVDLRVLFVHHQQVIDQTHCL
jgi:hypothetical protein